MCLLSFSTRGHLHEQQLSPLMVCIFYLPYKSKKLACMEGVENCLVGLNMFRVIYSHFSTFKLSKCQIKIAAQSCSCSTDANFEKEPDF